mgnify:CR=1 FL=1
MTALWERGLNRDGCIPIGACAFGAEGHMAADAAGAKAVEGAPLKKKGCPYV